MAVATGEPASSRKAPTRNRKGDARDQETVALRHLEDLPRLVSDWVWETDKELRLTFVSPRLIETLGFPPQKLLGVRLSDVGSFTSQAGFPFDLRSPAPFREEPFEAVDHEGRRRTFLVTGLPVFNNETEEFEGFRGTAEHITGRKQEEEALRNSWLWRAVEQNPSMVIVTDTDGTIEYVNHKFTEITGYSAEEAIGQDLRIIKRGKKASTEYADLWRTIKSGREWHGEFHNRRKDGSLFWTMASISPTRAPADGTITHFVAVEEDVTALKRAEEKLRAAKVQAKQANQATSRFLAAVSHDLRQPLHAMGMLCAALSRRTDETQGAGIVHNLEASVKMMSRMLDSLIEISKLGAGFIVPVVRTFPVNRVFDQIRARFTAIAQGKGVSLLIVPSSIVVRSDSVLLDRIISNFVSNAIHYTDTGKVVMGCRHQGSAARIEVWDNGVGIPEEYLQDIFKEFHRIDTPNQPAHHGLGLGLSIAQRFANLLDHPLCVRSTPGRGAVFSVELPRGRVADQDPGPRTGFYLSEERFLDGFFIVVIDDEEVILKSMKIVMEDWGADVLAVASCDEALARLSSRDVVPDLVIADYKLRNQMTGVEAIERIRTDIKPSIPCLILSGDANPQRLKQLKKSGFTVLCKPVYPGTLGHLLRDVFREKLAKLPAHGTDAVALGGAV